MVFVYRSSFFAASLVGWFCLSAPLSAQSDMSVVKQLLTVTNRKALTAAIKSAEGAGMSKQQLAEGKLLFGIRTEDCAFLNSAITEIETASIGFEPKESISGIGSVEQFRGLMSYARALMALDEGDEEEFRKNIEKGFWLFPEQGALFGRAVARLQLQQRMEYLRVDFSNSVMNTDGGEVTLSSLLGSHRGILFYCWRASAPESIQALKATLEAKTALLQAGIVLAGLNTDLQNADIAARDFKKANAINLPWLAEKPDAVLTRMCEINSVPRALLISERGHILFNGSPNEPAMWKAIQELAPTFEPPSRE